MKNFSLNERWTVPGQLPLWDEPGDKPEEPCDEPEEAAHADQ